MFGMVLERLYLQDMQKISGEVEQKICAVGVTNILTEAPAMIQNYEAFWWVYSPITENMSIFLYSYTFNFFLFKQQTFSCMICLFFSLARCKLLQAVISLFELPKDESTPDDEHFIEIEDTPGTCIA